MTYVIADTKSQADYWTGQRNIAPWKFVYKLEHLLGLTRNTTIIAVGPCEDDRTMKLIVDVEQRYGFKVRFLPDTM